MRSTDASFEKRLMAGAGPLGRPFRSITRGSGLPGVLALHAAGSVSGVRVVRGAGAGRARRQRHGAHSNIYQSSRISALQFRRAGRLFGLPLLVVVLLLAGTIVSPPRHQFQTITGKGYRPRIIESRPLSAYLTAGDPVGESSCSRSCFRWRSWCITSLMPF